MLCKPQHIATSGGQRADGGMEGPGEEETPNQDYQPASVAGPGCAGSGGPQGARPPQAARSRCTAAAVVFNSPEPPAATAPSAHLASQLSQPHLAPTCPVETGLGLCCPPRRQLVDGGWETGVGWETELRPESGNSSGRARRERQPLPLCDLELLGLSGLGLL